MKKIKPNIATNIWFQSWKLINESGKLLWKFKSSAALLKTHPVLQAKTSADLSAWQEAFRRKTSNPNPQDAVYRSKGNQSQKAKYKNSIPNRLHNQLEVGWDYFFSLQDEKQGTFPCDYGGPLFLLPGLTLFATITGYSLTTLQIKLMVQYILNHQNSDGGWGLHIEGESLMFTTVLNYVALRLWEEPANSPAMMQAREWIMNRGGATEVSTWGKIFLAVLGIYEWEGNHSWFPEAWLLPRFIPLPPHNYWCHARMVYLPLSYLFAVKFNALESKHLSSAQKNLLYKIRDEIYCEDYEKINWSNYRSSSYQKDNYFPITKIFKIIFTVVNGYEKLYSKWLRKQALKKILTFIQSEDENTQYLNLSPINKIYNALVVFLEWQNDPTDADKKNRFDKHCERISDYLWLAEDGLKMKGYSGSENWDVVFTLRAIMDGGIGWQERYQNKFKLMGEFIFGNQLANGGWTFSTKEQGWAVSDCSAEGLHSLLLLQEAEIPIMPIVAESKKFELAVDFLLDFQNPDGGWSSYEKCRGPKWLEKFNSSMVFANIMIDYSYVECTASNLQALTAFNRQYPNYKTELIMSAITRGCDFILNTQKNDGSWYGSWGVCFTYGTFFAVKGLSAVLEYSEKVYSPNNLEKKSSSILLALLKAGEFLLCKQDQDGSWGETPRSSITKTYHHLSGQVVHTAWALLTLNSISRVHSEVKIKTAIQKGVKFLLTAQLPNGDWPTQGITGVFNHNCMISYTNFRNIFPLWALTQVSNDKTKTKRYAKK